jgi:cytochrome c oxidase assembly factor CtaG
MMQQQIVSGSMSKARILTLLLGCVVALVAFALPMDLLGMSFMFTVHMAQHLLLSLAAPPLLLLSIPKDTLQQWLKAHPKIERGIRVLTKPWLASVIFNVNLWLWHAPPVLAVMMDQAGVHLCADLLYLLTGLLFWWPLLIPMQGQALSLGGKLAYLFFSDMPMMLLGAGMTFSGPLYTFAMGNPPRPMIVIAQDQQWAGLLMWVVGGLFFYLVVASIFFLQWMLRQEKMQQIEEAKFYEEDDEEEEEEEEEDEWQEPSDAKALEQVHHSTRSEKRADGNDFSVGRSDT